MGSKYFFTENSEADGVIDRILVQAQEAILEGLGNHVRAIFLVGSLARGEGAWKKAAGGAVITSDIDLLIVTGTTTHIPGTLYEKLKQLEADTGIEVALWIKSTLSLGLSHPTIDHMDIRETGKVIYGDKNIIDRMPFTESDIRFEEAVFLFFNRAMLTVIECSPQDFQSTDSTARQRLSLSATAIMATCTDIISISYGMYHPSPLKRAEYSRTLLPEIRAGIDKDRFILDLDAVLDYKLKQPDTVFIENTEEIWARARDYLVTLFRYFYEQHYGTGELSAYPDMTHNRKSLTVSASILAAAVKTACVMAKSGKRPRFHLNAKNLFYGKMAALSLFLALGKVPDVQVVSDAADHLNRVYAFKPRIADPSTLWTLLRDKIHELHVDLKVV